jgi:serine/threonine-protein kinase
VRTIGGRYELRGELASGGMATVHLARQLGAAGFARIVAVKRLHVCLARDPELVAMFLDEARLVGRIRHPNVVQTLDVVQETNEESGTELFIVMEYVHGDSLVRLLNAARKAGQSVPLKIASATAVGMLHGLHEAHEAKSEAGEPLGIVHRDVSPHNVLVGIDGVARVLDFGVAKAQERMSSSTEDGRVKGKLAYMAPEQIAGETTVDRRTDIYAAAIVFWEILTGKRLFHGPNDAATVKLVLDANVDAPSTLNPEVPAELDDVVLKALAKDPDRRYATAADFAQAIAEVVPPATASELGAWVRKTAQEDLELKTKLIAAIESRGIAKSKSEAAKSLEAVGKTQVVTDAPTSPERSVLQKTQPMPQPAAPGTLTRTVVMVSSPPPPLPLAPATENRASLLVGAAAAAGALLVVGGLVAFFVVKAKKPEVITTAPSSNASTPAPMCPEGMVLAPAGHYFMGSDEHSSAEKPAHKISLHAFCIDRLEVTTEQYRGCTDRGECRRPMPGTTLDELPPKLKKTYDALCNANDMVAKAKHPANCVDWDHAKELCAARGARLPTEAEWEYAARGPEQRMYAWGEQAPSPALLNGCGAECARWLKGHAAPMLAPTPLYGADDGWPTTSPVGSFPAGASRIGAEDLQGNVWEWVADYYALYGKEEASDPTGPESGRDRVIRGGAWDSSNAEWLRATYRSPTLPSTRSHLIGFRCAKSLSADAGNQR